jgi:NADH:ubiquinone oxidoreductase subunit F (NADH-binding)
MDRSILEGDPHSVIEGMLIAARGHRLQAKATSMPKRIPAGRQTPGHRTSGARLGLLGDNICGTDFSFHFNIASRGAGAFVCGESTALMASLEGKPGRPRAKYVHTVEKGFREAPPI